MKQTESYNRSTKFSNQTDQQSQLDPSKKSPQAKRIQTTSLTYQTRVDVEPSASSVLVQRPRRE
jgi:hypothetical protein